MTADRAFNRLRAANPFSPATDVDADSLFAWITTTAPDRRLSRPPRRYRRAVLVLAIALALVAVVASTAPAISTWIGNAIGRAEVDSEYAQAQRLLDLPPGYSWPKWSFPSDAVTSRGAGGALAVTIAQGAWECYWVRAIRDRDVARQTRAHAALLALLANHVVIAPEHASENWSPPQTGAPTAVYADDGGFQFKQRTYAAAAAGQPLLLELSCRANGPTR